MSYSYSVRVIELSTGAIVRDSVVIGLKKAEKLARGLELNLSDRFFVEVVEL